jgi:hypothetical protein
MLASKLTVPCCISSGSSRSGQGCADAIEHLRRAVNVQRQFACPAGVNGGDRLSVVEISHFFDSRGIERCRDATL